MLDFSLPQKIAIWALPVLFAITVHEVAHGFVARRLGDRTAQMMGRLTLNPLKHIDPVGTVLVPLAMLLLPGGFLFGWAKPVPIGYNNLGNPKRDMAIVAAAGPLSNLLMAAGWALLLRLSVELLQPLPWAAQPLFFMAQAGIAINLILMILNLVPIPPLDGGRVLTGLLPVRQAAALGAIEPYGLIIVLALLLSGVLWRILQPVIQLFNQLLLVMVGLGGSA
ncbi:MAG TPA: site-2 protease family protein [Gammaproteobacteria bacterium]|nr:site-2 protease family protein [Gammaproteobacteria bacterium]HCZ47778.1 site-2 protease family protein [Gammaproteobacteria bacterium]MCH77216.1 site-2 protease family protein [Gammaproteobacteria bacterium]